MPKVLDFKAPGNCCDVNISGVCFWGPFLAEKDITSHNAMVPAELCWSNVEWESAKVSHKRVFALLTPELPHLEMAQMLQKPVFALPGCQQISVNTLLCDTLGLADGIP